MSIVPARLMLAATAVVAFAAPATLAGCPAFNPIPCFPTSSATPLPESEGGFSRTTLMWEIDKMAALVDVPESDAPPTDVFLRAQRDMRTEFWLDAAKGFLSVVRGDTSDGKKIRQHAQFDLAVSLFRLRYFDDAKRIFRMIAADSKHPRNREANEWMQRKVCSA